MTIRNVTDELLSAYIDDELDEVSAKRVEASLRESPVARQRLEELESVVRDLRGLDRESPPPELHQRLKRQIVLDPEPAGFRAKLDAQRGRYLLNQSLVWTLLGVILAMALIILLLAQAFDGQGSSIVVVGDDGGRRSVADREFLFDGVAWREVGTGEGERREVQVDSEEGLSLWAEEAWLAELAAAAGPDGDGGRRLPEAVVFRWGGEDVELVLRELDE